jgi:hypothetical protein
MAKTRSKAENEPPGPDDKASGTAKPGRAERLAAALRTNLARRKAQARERHGAQLRPTEGTTEPGDPGAPGAANEQESHDSAGFVGDKPLG